MKTGGGEATHTPKIPSPAPTHPKIVIFMHPQKMEPPNSTVPKAAGTGQRMQVLRAVHTEISLETGPGGAGVPPAYASPFMYMARERDPHQGLRCPRCWICRGPHPGPPFLSGVSALSPAPHPVRTLRSAPTW